MKKVRIQNNLAIAILIILATIFLFISYIPNMYEASVADLLPQDRVLLWGEHVYTYDYNTYLSKIRQGAEGRWLVVDKYDNDPQSKGSFLQMLYLLTGKVGGIFRLTPTLTFHLLRTLLSFIWIMTIIYLNIKLLKKPLAIFMGVILCLMAASFPVFFTLEGQPWVGYHMGWWSEMNNLERISYIPHYTINYILISLLTILLYQLSSNLKSKVQSSNVKSNPKLKNQINKKNIFGFWILKLNWILDFEIWIFTLICLILFISFFIHPSAGLVFLFSWLIFFLLRRILRMSQQDFGGSQLFEQRSDERARHWRTERGTTGRAAGGMRVDLPRKYWLANNFPIIATLVLFIIALIPLLYFRHITSSYPWKSLIDFDKRYQLPFQYKDYILALGPVFFTGIAGLLLALKKRSQEMLPLISWVLAAFLGILFFTYFPFQSRVRFIQTANHIPLAILSAYFFYELVKKYKNIAVKIVIYLLFTAIITLGIVQTVYAARSKMQFIHQRAVAAYPLVPYPSQVMYPLSDFWNGILWLEKNTNRNDVVLSKITAGNYIPAYAGNFVYLGHNPETPHFEDREIKIKQFYSFNMSPEETKKFLKDNNIAYIFYGPQEKEESGGKPSPYNFLVPVYQSNHVTIYIVK